MGKPGSSSGGLQQRIAPPNRSEEPPPPLAGFFAYSIVQFFSVSSAPLLMKRMPNQPFSVSDAVKTILSRSVPMARSDAL